MAETTDDLIRLLRAQAPVWSEPFGVRSLQIFLEDLLGRSVDLVTEQALRQELRQSVEADAINV
jgi:hypothetical protein